MLMNYENVPSGKSFTVTIIECTTEKLQKTLFGLLLVQVGNMSHKTYGGSLLFKINYI